MVTHLNIALDDDVAERARETKEGLGLTWAGFIERAANELQAGQHRGSVGDQSEVVKSQAEEYEESTTFHEDVRGLDLPGSGEMLEQRREAIQLLYNHLRERGSARRRDFLELVEPEEVGYASAESFWTNCVKGRDALKTLPGVAAPGEGEHTWRYVGGGG